jgi:hypothetical protein
MKNREETLADGLLYLDDFIDIEPSDKNWIRRYIDRYSSAYCDPCIVNIKERFEYETECEFDEIALEEWAMQCGHCISRDTKRAYEIGDYYYSSDAISEWIRELEDSKGLEQLCRAFFLNKLPEIV